MSQLQRENCTSCRLRESGHAQTLTWCCSSRVQSLMAVFSQVQPDAMLAKQKCVQGMQGKGEILTSKMLLGNTNVILATQGKRKKYLKK